MEKINIETWNRREVYELFSNIDYPFYSVTMPIDITKVKEVSKTNQLSFYYLMIWVCTKAVNRVPALNMRIREEDVVLLDQTHPSFTAMKQGEECFKIITVTWDEDARKFCTIANQKVNEQTTLFGKSDRTDDLIYFSCTPWFDFTSMTNEHNFDRSDTIPRIAWGQYYKEEDRLMVHLSIEVNHRTIDGFHLGQFKTALDEEINSLSEQFSRI